MLSRDAKQNLRWRYDVVAFFFDEKTFNYANEE